MQNQLDNRVYAGFFVRLIAYAIDSLIATIVVAIVKLPLSLMAMAGVSFLKANFIFQYSVLDVFGYLGVVAYFVLLTYYTHSTPGKMLMKLEVVTAGGDWTFLNVLYRETVGRFLSSLLCIGYLAIMVQEKKQGFHDMLCDTYVVYRDMVQTGNRKNQPVAAAGVTMEPDGNEERNTTVGEESPSAVVNPEIVRTSAFEMPESHPVDTSVPEPSTEENYNSYDGLNPDSGNLYRKNEETE